jgi:peptidoglycan-N-acetylglucosamine deacetylase
MMSKNRFLAIRIVVTSMAVQLFSCTIVYADRYAGPAHTEVIRNVPTSQKVVALTFDDGPSATFTPQVVELLKRYHAKGTFFVIGSRAQQYPELIHAELRARDEVANHTYSHVVLEHQTERKIHEELERGHEAVSCIDDHGASYLFRPPRGRYNKRLSRIAGEAGYKTILWSIDSRDWSNPGTAQIVKNIMSDVRNGDIILLHDQGGNRTQTLQALARIIPKLEDKGYQCVTVSQLLASTSDDKWVQTDVNR